MPLSDAREIKAPSALLTLTELQRAGLELAALPLAAPALALAPRGDGAPVLVMPGFITSDRSTVLLRRYLSVIGYDARAWELGRNLGPRSVGWRGERLLERLQTIHRDTGQKVGLVGWSLGGILARDLARAAPEMVSKVITLGSPFTGNPLATAPARLYERLSGETLSGAAIAQRLRESVETLPVPAAAIFSRDDGVVPWRNCVEPPHPRAENIEVRGSHCGLGVNAAVLYAVADRLAQADDDWKPFAAPALLAGFYPPPPALN